MDYYGIGYSNIRLPNSSKSYVYRYDRRINTFPEEVFLHEFLHTLERNSNEYGYEVPVLHDYQKYSYTDDKRDGLRKWYIDYMNRKVKYKNGNYIGLPEKIYSLKPAKTSDFTYSNKLNKLDEPKNIVEIIECIVQKTKKIFEKSNKDYNIVQTKGVSE